MHNKQILITGATGFIGSHLAEFLVERGFGVVAFDRYNPNNHWGLLEKSKYRHDMEIILGDVRDYDSVYNAMKGCDTVFHLAALIGIPYSYISPLAYIRTNIEGTYNVLEAARQLNLKQVVIASTSEVYGTAQYVPIDEKHPLQPQSPYSASKIGADQMALSFHLAFGLPVTVARPFNTYGPRQSARAVIPTIITQIAAGSKKIKLGSLHPTRDFNYIKDIVNGFIAVAESEKSVGEVMNIGSNFEISIGETVNLVAEVMGIEIETDSDEVRLRPEKSEVERLWADNSKAKNLTGWEPLYAGKDGFRRGLFETVEWFTNPENLKNYKADLYNV